MTAKKNDKQMKKAAKIILIILYLSGTTNIFAQYYSSISTSSATFITDLQTLIRSNYVKKSYNSYDENMIPSFYAQDNGDGTNSVFCVYSNYEYTYSGIFTWAVFSREHTFCYSWMPTHGSKSTIEYQDYHHLFPTHQNKANAVRSNHPLGVVANVTSSFVDGKYGTDINSDNVYEPRDAHKGDAARAILYMTFKYDGINGNNWDFDWLNGTKLPALNEAEQSLETLLAWHNQDPPDAWEISRNDHIYTLQNNRNPFIDHPEYTDYINFNDMSKIEPLNLITELFFTEYVEGSSNNKAIEIYNGTGAAIDLDAEGYVVELYYNGSSTVGNTIALSGIILNNDVFVITHSSATATLTAQSDLISGKLNFNGNDAVLLKKGSTTIDVIGQIGFDPGNEWGVGNVSTKDNTIRRKITVTSGDSNGSDIFDPTTEWDGFLIDSFDDVGSALPVELTSFTATLIDGGVMLNWATATEVNNYGFDVQRMLSGVEAWETVGFVNGHGNSNSPKEYSFVDATITKWSQSYRLKQIDNNGDFEYSDVITVANNILKTELHQNYPNPFNPSTVIKYEIEETRLVSLKIYNLLGENVATLVDENQIAGSYEVIFNSSVNNFASGFYFYTLSVGNYIQTKKMLLLK